MAIHTYDESTIYSNVGTYYLKADLYENSTSVANNTSNVTITATLRSNSASSFSGNGGTLYVDWWDNKTNGWTNKNSVSISSLSKGTSQSTTSTFNVSHNSNGSLRGEVRARWVRGTNEHAPVSKNVYTDEISLTTLPRQSGISISKYNQSIADNVILITIDRKLSNYTDTISWTCGNLSETLQTKGSTTKIALYFDDNAYNTIAPPSGYTKIRSTYSNADLMNLILSWSSVSPDNPNQNITFTTSTYNGNTLIGSNTYTFKYEIYQTPFINNLSYETTDTLSSTLTGSNDIVINGISKVLVTNTLTKNQYFNDNVQAVSYMFTASNVGGVTQASNSYEFPKILGSIIRSMVTDARNKSTSMSQGAIELDSSHFKNYVTPTISSLDASRPESTSSTINWEVDGTFWNGNFGSVSNVLHVYYRYKVDDGTYNSYTEVTPTISSNDFEYSGTISVVSTSEATLEIKIVDSTNSEYILQKTIPKGNPVFDIGDGYFNVNGLIAQNGNPIQEKIKYIEASSSTDITLSAASTSYKIPLTNLILKTDKFELYNGGIKCKKNGVISVSASAMISPRNGYVGLIIFKNNVYSADTYEPSGNQSYGVITLSNRLFSVEENDVIYFYAQSSTANDVVKNNVRTRVTLIYM